MIRTRSKTARSGERGETDRTARREDGRAEGGAGHVPVLRDAVIAALEPRDNAVYVDGTFGAGGYSTALLGAARCSVIAIDRDPEAIRSGAELAARHPGRLTLIEGRFGDMAWLVAAAYSGPIAGVTLDLGVSSPQLDSAERGFSFQLDGPLDMRMSKDGESAADLVARISEDELEGLIRALGEERFARRIARAIVTARQHAPIRRTGELAEIIRTAVPTREPGLDPATRTFQALRIAVNDELGELERGLAGAEQLLMPGGRLAVVSFHSLEDSRVKSFLRERSGEATAVSRHMPVPVAARKPSFRLLGRRAVRPGAAEVARNSRARSARLRVAERIAVPP